MSKLVDKERLAKLAKALDDRAKAAVAAEKERALAAEQAVEAKADANKAAIDAIEHAETGILAQAKAHAQGLVEAEKGLREEEEGKLADRIGTLEGIVGGNEEGSLGDLINAVAGNTAKANTNEAAIAKLNGGAEAEGSVAKAVADAVKVEKDRAEGVEAGFETRIAANEAFIAKQSGIDAEQDRRLGVLEGLISGGEGDENALTQLQNAIDTAQDAAEAAQADVDAVEQRLDAEGGLVDRIEANEANITRLDGDVNVEGSVKKQIKDAIDAVNGAAETLAGRVEAVENFRDVTYPAAESKVREDFAAADGVALQAAKDYADDLIEGIINGSVEGMDTLKELADAIDANKDVYDAYVEQHAAAMTKMKEDLQKEIDDDVKAVVDAQKLVNEAQAETNEGFEERIAANEGFVTAQPDIDKEQDRRIGVLEAAVGKGGATAEAIQAAQDAADAAQGAADDAQAAADKAQGEVDALEERLDKDGGLVDRLEAAEAFVQGHSHEALQGEIDAAEGRLDALEAFEEAHDHGVMEQGIAANKAAIEKEVEDRDAAIEEALKAYSTTEEMKQVIGNVVNSLALTMENDQVVLKLGGVDGVQLASVSLDIATDADIDAIIAGLDAPAGE